MDTVEDMEIDNTDDVKQVRKLTPNQNKIILLQELWCAQSLDIHSAYLQ